MTLHEALAQIPPGQLRNAGLYTARRARGRIVLLLRYGGSEWEIGRAETTNALIAVSGAILDELKTARAEDAIAPTKPYLVRRVSAGGER